MNPLIVPSIVVDSTTETPKVKKSHKLTKTLYVTAAVLVVAAIAETYMSKKNQD